MNMQARNRLDKANIVIRTLYFILYAIWNIALISVMVYAGINEAGKTGQPDGGAESNIGYIFVLLIIGVVIGGIGNLIVSGVAVVGLICAACNKGDPNRKKTVIFYICLIVLPIVTEVLFTLGSVYIPKFL